MYCYNMYGLFLKSNVVKKKHTWIGIASSDRYQLLVGANHPPVTHLLVM